MDLLEEWLDKGFHVVVGPHVNGLRGYYACIYPDKTPRCTACTQHFNGWKDCGHGETAEEAIDDAVRLAFGLQPVNATEIEDYRD